jgi:hypothetical protein
MKNTRNLKSLLLTLAPFLFMACSRSAATQPRPDPASQLVPGVWHDMIYHVQLQKILLVNGGPENGKPANDPLTLWAWENGKWTLKSNNGPRWRNFASVAYDSSRGALILYGGLQSASVQFAETWSWDGRQWMQHSVSGPGFREAAGMAYDVARGKVILFGGAQNDAILNDTWEWVGQTWKRLSTSGPSPRFPGGFVYDGGRKVVLLCGGHHIDFSGGRFQTFDDTWKWNGAAWTQIMTNGPTPRDGARAVFNAKSKQVVLFGGIQITPAIRFLNDTWIWDGSRWTEAAVDGPPERGHHAMAYDVARDRVMVFGGTNGPGPQLLSDTWEWDGAQWIKVDRP